MHRSNIICPISDACTAVRCYLDGAGFVLGITFCMRECRGRPMYLRCYCPPVLGGRATRATMLSIPKIGLQKTDINRNPNLVQNDNKT